MGTREGQYWRTVKPAFSGWDPQRVETPDADGVPDVDHKFGNVELKYAREWPKRPDTPFRLDHYSPQQRVWHKRRCRAGGLCHVLVGVGKEHLLIWGEVASEYLGNVTRMELIMRADAHFENLQDLKKGLRDAILARS